MKKLLITAILLGNLSGMAMAQQFSSCGDSPKVSVMAGLAYSFGSSPTAENLGFTLKAVNTNAANHFAVGAGGTFFPWSDERFGLDLSGGYNSTESSALLGYDFLKQTPVVSGGWVDTVEEKTDCVK